MNAYPKYPDGTSDGRQCIIGCNQLIERLADDRRLGLSRNFLGSILAKGDEEFGTAKSQIAAFASAVRKLEAAYPEAAAYGPGSML